jgi:ribose/xylose/arabinose/galactoside ABC-type transport system permease subunit
LTGVVRQFLRKHLWQAILEIVLIVICVVLAVISPDFLTIGNLLNVLRSVSEIGVIAFGMTMVIIAGEIDLSVGSAVAFAGCLTAYLVQSGVPVPLAIVVALALGFGIGSFTGAIRARYNVPSFITSLALLTGLRGAALKITGGFSLTPFPEWYNFLGSGYILGIPFPAVIFVTTFAVVFFLMNYTTFGRSVYAVGGNAEAARLCAINVSRVRIMVLGITGVLAALSGIMLSSRMLSGNPTVGYGWELDVIAAVIVGGTSLTGGTGRVWGTLIGVIFIGVIVNGMRLLDVHEDGQLIARGVIIVLAVLLGRLQQVKG